MKLMLTIGRLASVATLSAAFATAQTAPPSGSTPASPPAPKVISSPVPAPVEPGTASGTSLEFKPPTADVLLPPPEKTVAAPSSPDAGPQVPPVVGAASVPVRIPPPVPGGPKVIESEPAPEVPTSSRPVAPLPPAGAAAQKQGKPYVLGPLDVVEVRVWNDPKLSGIFDVGTDGTISVPLVGPIMANGLTAAELMIAIRDKLTAVIIEPEVNVQVLRNNSKKFTILGGCARTGEFPLVGEVTILDALANCGGFKEFANLKKVYVLRGTKQLKFNYREVIKGKNMEQNIPLENGDRIVVPDN